MTLDTMCAVVDELRKRGVSADLEYPGCIHTGNIVWGDANETFEGDVYEGDECIEVIESTLPSSSDDIQRIATHICCYQS